MMIPLKKGSLQKIEWGNKMQLIHKQILVVEDNKYSMNRICSILKDIEGITIIKADNSGEAYQYATEYSIDLFIIDIILDSTKEADVSGMTFAEAVRKMDKYKMTPIIFTTCLEDPELHAYAHLHCYEYFRKPYDLEKLKEAIVTTLQMKTTKYEKEYVCFKVNGIVFPVKIKDIVCIDNRTTSIHIQCANGESIDAPYKSSRQMLLELNSNKFLKCNKSIIINTDFIESINYQIYEVKLKNNFGKVKIGRRILKSFKEGLANC